MSKIIKKSNILLVASAILLCIIVLVFMKSFNNKRYSVSGTKNEEAQRLADQVVEIDVNQQLGKHGIENVQGYPKFIIGKDKKIYLVSLSAIYQKEGNGNIDLRLDVSGSQGAHAWVGWTITPKTDK